MTRIRDAVDEWRDQQEQEPRERDRREPEPKTDSKPEFQRFSIVETSQMSFANADGAVTVQPGETKTLVEWQSTGDQQQVLALGATDRPYTEYALVSDETVKFRTYSPLGLVNNPFSFKSELGFTYPVGRIAQYRVTRSANATDPADYAARLFMGER